MSFEVKRPVLVIGIGGAGARLAREAGRLLPGSGCDGIMVISNDESDLQLRRDDSGQAGAAPNTEAIAVDTGAVVNPTMGLIRASAYERIDAIRKCIAGHPTVLLIGNLAGRSGCAISPVISEACAAEGAELLSLAVMPFGYEKSRIFESGVALKRLRQASACTIVIDNDSLLESNPDLSPEECYDIADAAIMYVVSSLKRTDLQADTDNLLAASRGGGTLEESLRDALKALYGSGGGGAARHSMIYAIGGSRMPAGMLHAISNITEAVLEDSVWDGGKHAAGAAATAEAVAVQPFSASSLSSGMVAAADESRVVMLSTVQGMEKFEAYDPLGQIISDDRTLDWDMPSCSMDCGLDGIYQME